MSSDQIGAVDPHHEASHKFNYFLQVCEDQGTTLYRKNVLTIGCGDGALTNALSDHEAHVTGLDRSVRKLTEDKIRNPNITYRKGDAEHLPFERDSFDVVIAFGVWHSLDRPKVLSEASRVLTEHGTLLIVSESVISPNESSETASFFPEEWYEEWEETKWNISNQWSVEDVSSKWFPEKTFFQNDLKLNQFNLVEVETHYNCITLRK